MLRTLLVLLLFTLPPAAIPDEGEWLPTQFRAMDWSGLKARGLELSKDAFWHPENGGVLSAAIQINGCSASFVSADGLIVTNHHCGFGAIAGLSNVEDNYVEKGFVAESRAQELPAPGMRVSILDRIEDVTGKIHAAQAAAGGDEERFLAVEDAKRRLVAEAEARTRHTRCSIESFFEGRKYLLYYRTQLTDVRLVYAPPRSVGEFGGDEDNWMWPRHTGDFCFFRAYASEDNTPAAHDAKNVPYRPKHWLKVSGRGLREGDLALILGYPGRTERYLTSTLLRSRESVYYPLRLRILNRLIEVLDAAGEGDARMKLRLSSRRKSFANVQKNAEGMIQGLRRNAVVAHKLAEEREFLGWVAGKADRKARHGDVLKRLQAIDEGEASTAAKDLILVNILRNCPVLFWWMQATYAAGEKALPEEQRERGYKARDLARLESQMARNYSRLFERLERPSLAALVDIDRSLPAGKRLGVFDSFLESGTASRAGTGEGQSLVDLVFGTTSMKGPSARVDLYRAGVQSMTASQDPLVVLARRLAGEYRAWRLRERTRSGARLAVGALWIEAQEAWRGSSFYPDANRTLRISVATCKGYRPFDGARYDPFTTLAGVLEKERGEEPFKSPPGLLAAARSKDKGRFADPVLKDVPVCFLLDGDTTGGNSGSPVINGRGELVGLNFDRVFENVAGDYRWTPERSRNISVDIRYVLWILDKVMPAPHLLREMGF